MSDPGPYLWLIPALPLAAAIVTGLLALTDSPLRRHAHWPCIVAAIASFVLSVLVLRAVAELSASDRSWITYRTLAEATGTQPPERAAPPGFRKTYYTWFETGQPRLGFDLPPDQVNVGITFRADTLTALMLVTVTFVGSLIVIYSAGYMHGDEGYARYFAEVALFIFAMTGLVLADNFLLLYAFWEGVGLCSYLLIGFWYSKPSAAAAARKAFLVTRLGDIGLILGIILIWAGFQKSPGVPLNALDYDTIFHYAAAQPHGLLVAACLLLFCGAVGKSAQFPLHVWLPDAMEGPTPVSALIHAATMVTAGVYLVARCTPLFEHAPEAQLIVAGIGGFTALLAALIALTQNDLKRVLAYSTVSQLGYMFLALGSGAVVAGMFHLFTHAFFKALLFLAAGSVMHAMGNVIDMRRFGGLRRVLPVTHWTFLCGAAALAAVPFVTSGFWSKDEILAGTFEASRQRQSDGWVYALLFIASLVTAGLTAFYTFRAYFLTFWGEEKIPHEAGEHAHESPLVMTGPLAVLAVGAIVAGFANPAPFAHPLDDFLEPSLELPPPPVEEGAALTERPARHEEVNWLKTGLLWLGSIAFTAAGIGGAWWLYERQRRLASQLAADLPGLYQLSLNKFYLDELYAVFVVAPMEALAQISRVIDYVVDGVVDLVGRLPELLGRLFRPMQNGLVQFYALAMALSLMVFLLALTLTRWF
ncbi:MAG TPA: NADH-quinone oxidoreductase subunit L [Gemmataceae bacterium]|nr:NADH-quinone oxidoreductase subunit L [Gemmataceae bacterium]